MGPDETRWLDANEQEAWIPFVSVLLMLPAALDAQLRESGLTFYEYTVLAGLSHFREDGLRMSDLARVTSGGLPRLSQVVSRMEERGWVARRPDPTDGRATRVVLQPEGASRLEAAAPGHVTAVREAIFDQITPAQVEQLRRIAHKIALTLTGPDSLVQARRALGAAERSGRRAAARG